MTKVTRLDQKVNLNTKPQFPQDVSENVLTLLCMSDKHGKLVRELMEPHQFCTEVHRTYAARAIAYWQKYGCAPGKAHVADIVMKFLQKDNPRHEVYRATLNGMLALDFEGINAKYVIDSVKSLQRLTALRLVTLKSAELLEGPTDETIPQVERVMADALKPGTQMLLDDDELDCADYGNLVRHLQRRQDVEFSTGIPELDRCGVVPSRGTLNVMLAPSGAGKTWWLIHLAKNAILAGKKVLFITLELDQDDVQQRLYQGFGRAAQREYELNTTVSNLQLENGRLLGFEDEGLIANCHLADHADVRVARKLVRGIIEHREHVFRRLRVKRFPMHSLTIPQLRAYLDLRAATGFVPDLLIVDYLGLLKTSAENHRIELGHATAELRGLGTERNLAIVTAQQVNRDGQKVKVLTRVHVAEDISLINTSDIAMTMTHTDREEERGLVRIYVDKARHATQGFTTLVAQNLAHGQFRRQSLRLPANYPTSYFELLENLPTRGQLTPFRG